VVIIKKGQNRMEEKRERRILQGRKGNAAKEKKTERMQRGAKSSRECISNAEGGYGRNLRGKKNFSGYCGVDGRKSCWG